jgi:hypothetical protein
MKQLVYRPAHVDIGCKAGVLRMIDSTTADIETSKLHQGGK